MLWLPWASKDLACPQAQGASRCGERSLSLSRRFWRVEAVRPSLDPWKSATSLYWAPPSAPSKDRICPSPAVSNQSLCMPPHAPLSSFSGGGQHLMSIIFSSFHSECSPKSRTWLQDFGGQGMTALGDSCLARVSVLHLLSQPLTQGTQGREHNSLASRRTAEGSGEVWEELTTVG